MPDFRQDQLALPLSGMKQGNQSRLNCEQRDDSRELLIILLGVSIANWPSGSGFAGMGGLRFAPVQETAEVAGIMLQYFCYLLDNSAPGVV